MEDRSLLYMLGLSKAKGVGPFLIKQIIHQFGSARAFFNTDLSRIKDLDKRIVLSDKEKSNLLKEAEQEIRFIHSQNINCHYFEDDNYPQHLKHCPDAPILLFSKGNINFSSGRFLSIVGTRKATQQGLKNCHKIINELTEYNPTIVSGFAYGIDIAAHNSAIKNNLQTIAILAHGLDQIYPPEHRKYISDVNKKGGFITDFFSGINPERHNFLKRNRIIAGISHGTLVIESLKSGGSLITAELANGYDKDVFTIPGKIDEPNSEGCNNLIKYHKAQLITNGQDIAQQLNWEPVRTTKQHHTEHKTILSKFEQQVYNALLKNGKAPLDELAITLHKSIPETTTCLMQMELKGILKDWGGKTYGLV